MSSALFGNAARASSKNLIEFRAGKMVLKSKMVHPDKRKGLLYIYQSEDSLMHFCWKDRSTGSVEEDLIIFPDDCEYKRITACTTGRAYVLKFRTTTRRLFFWMQDPKTDKDDENCRKINDFLNNPPQPGVHATPSRSSGLGGSSSSGTSSGGSSSANAASAMLGGDLSNLRDADLQSLIGNISQQQLMQILGSGVPNLSSLLTSNSRSSNTSVTPTTASTPTTGGTPPPPSVSAPSTVSAMDTSTTVTASGAGASSSTASKSGDSKSSSSEGSKGSDVIKLSDVQSILNTMRAKEGSSVDLSSAMTAEALKPILSNPAFVEELKPFLPESSDKLPSEEHLKGTITSPQFKQAVSMFSQALQSGQLGPLINQFGLGEAAVLAAASGNMEAFVQALSKKNKAKKEDSKDRKEDDDESMAVD